jgi:hypothetical protein
MSIHFLVDQLAEHHILSNTEILGYRKLYPLEKWNSSRFNCIQDDENEVQTEYKRRIYHPPS